MLDNLLLHSTLILLQSYVFLYHIIRPTHLFFSYIKTIRRSVTVDSVTSVFILRKVGLLFARN
jgi:hypothetical protein